MTTQDHKKTNVHILPMIYNSKRTVAIIDFYRDEGEKRNLLSSVAIHVLPLLAMPFL